MGEFSFKITSKDKKTQARTGMIQTAHGEVETPAFVPVGTQATVKSLSSEDLKEIGVQLFFVNTYHMYLRPGLGVIKKFGGLHQFMNWDGPLMTDSAGFQIFSLGEAHRQRRLKMSGTEIEMPLVRINEEGVTFRSHLDGSEHVFTPEKSIEAQTILGADIMIAFDECAPYPATHDYVEKAMERTHRWAERCLKEKEKLKSNQALYGVVQGGVFENLRKQSAEFISGLDFEGIAIGGVAVGESKREMVEVLDWVTPRLPEEKPKHLLGVGEIDDIFALVERGIDTFDCVMPTRLGRMGQILVKNQRLDMTKAIYAEDKGPLDKECQCPVCHNYSRAYVHHLFRAKELLAYRLATFHNLWVMEELVGQIRQAIGKARLKELKAEWLNH